VAVPVYSGAIQIGKAHLDHLVATPEKMIALATLKRGLCQAGTKSKLRSRWKRSDIDQRKVAKTPFYNPKHKTATPI